MVVESGWSEFRCACGFRLVRVPRDILDQLPRCLGCGRPLRSDSPRPRVRTPASVDVRDLR